MKKALVVIDMQNDFISGALGSAAARAIVPRVVRKLKIHSEMGSRIIFTRDTHTPDYLNTQEGMSLPVVHCVKDTPGWRIADEIATAVCLDDCQIFDKGGFGSVELAQYLRDEVYEEIELLGLVSSICVVSNALLIKAYLPEAKLSVDASCTAGITEEDYQASLCVLKMCQIQLA
ncbi:MAG: cysteine hydrolase [Peptococcaceae bacterium]|nr:cysteine hydrolase [Peptococcaceae bacterium]